MSILLSEEPRRHHTTVARMLDRFFHRGRRPALNGVRRRAVRHALTIPIYDLRRDSVAARRTLSAARRSGVLFFVTAAGVVIATVELRTAAAKRPLAVGLNFGSFGPACAKLLEELQNEGFDGDRWEIRMLRLAATHVIAVWLKGTKTGKNILFPISPAPRGLPRGRPCKEGAFLKAVRKIEKKVVQPLA